MGTRILTKELDSRLYAVEQKLAELADHLARLEQWHRETLLAEPAEVVPAPSSGNGQTADNGASPVSETVASPAKIAELEALIMRLDDRLEKIASSIVTQVARL
jgi:hypothetical protein